MTRYLIYCKGDILLTREGHIPLGHCPVELKPWQHVTTLHATPSPDASQAEGCHASEGCATVEVCAVDSPITSLPDYEMVPLRKTFGLLSTEDHLLAGKGAELVYWHQQTRYCGCCGTPLEWQTDISKHCPQCGKEWWPSPAVAIIVRVERGDEILMIHAHSFRGPFYGLVAGFVETGETLEQTVHREVWEETRLRIRDVRYFGSQPWPYPCGLMVGFTAQYESGDIELQRSELGGGGWFSLSHMSELPAPGSISRDLIDDWLQRHTPPA